MTPQEQRRITGELAAYVGHVRTAVKALQTGEETPDGITRDAWKDDLQDALQVIVGDAHLVAEAFGIDL